MTHRPTAALALALALATATALPSHAQDTTPPAPFGAVPSDRQLAWHELEMYAFVHFSINTFTDAEWGFGDTPPTRFNPTDFDADQIVRTFKDAGFRAVILTCKHHDGFCLWPTETTTHSVASSDWMDGQGDVVRAFADACRDHDLKFGVYVSPWDRNAANYGTPEYVTDVFRPQIAELLTNYGDVFEVWFDGANGGDGYYGGARETRRIDRATYYDWHTTWQMVRDLMPNAVMFSDVGPGCRWIGNERGIAGDPCWATYTPTGRDGSPNYGPGQSDYTTAPTGTRFGRFWLPGECDVSIRPGWFYHASQDHQVRSPANLMDLYLQSIGRGATFLLNVPPDRRGQLHDNDVASLTAFGEHLTETFNDNLAADATFTASDTRGDDDSAYGPAHLVDDDLWSAWVTGDFVHTPDVVLDLPEARTFNLIRLREDIRLGQRVGGVAVDAFIDGDWREVAAAQSVGASRVWRIPAVTTDRVRLRVTDSPVCPALSDFGLYLEPAIAGQPQAATTHLPRDGWAITATVESPNGGAATNLLDGDPATKWNTFPPGNESGLPQSVTLDLGEATTFAGFAALPRQDNTAHGMIDRYTFAVSDDGDDWHVVSEGEFSNVRANPIEQVVRFGEPVTARYARFTATSVLELDHAVLAELNLLPAD